MKSYMRSLPESLPECMIGPSSSARYNFRGTALEEARLSSGASSIARAREKSHGGLATSG